MLRNLRQVVFVCSVLGLALGLSAPAEAATITAGSAVSFTGNISPTTDFMTTNSIDIVNETAFVTCGSPFFPPCLGDYSVVTSPQGATYNDFTFNPLPGGGYVPLWTFSQAGVTYSFDLLAITNITRATGGIVLEGTGLASIDAATAAAEWSFSADATGAFVFSSTTATTVPDGGSTAALLGSLLVGFGVVRRRFSLR